MLGTTRFSVLFFLTIFTAVVNAGPFGLSMGMQKSELEGIVNIKQDQYKTTSVPKPHSHFDYYVLQVGDKAGLCIVRAINRTIITNRYGLELRSEFNEMEELLTKKYGEHRTIDLLLNKSILNEPHEFMSALTRKERYLLALWGVGDEPSSNSSYDESSSDYEDGYASSSGDEVDTKLPSNLIEISLTAHGLGNNLGAISIQYTFSNRGQCNEEHEAIEEESL